MAGGGKGNIIKALEQLDKKDIYCLILFFLYRLKEIPEYSTLSELIYILDNESFIKFLNYYGGKTIKVPNVDDLSIILDALLIYEKQQNDKLSIEDAKYKQNEKVYKYASDMCQKELKQAVEGMYHNLK